MKLTIFRLLSSLIFVGFLIACNNGGNNKPKKDDFEDVLNDTQANSKKVGEKYGIKYFQVEKDGKTGFRYLDGKIVIAPRFDDAEMFSEGYSAVEVGKKWGLIDESGKYKIKPGFEYLGSVRNGLASYGANDMYGFVDITGKNKINHNLNGLMNFLKDFVLFEIIKGNMDISIPQENFLLLSNFNMPTNLKMEELSLN
jgi:hypothetical protein